MSHGVSHMHGAKEQKNVLLRTPGNSINWVFSGNPVICLFCGNGLPMLLNVGGWGLGCAAPTLDLRAAQRMSQPSPSTSRRGRVLSAHALISLSLLFAC